MESGVKGALGSITTNKASGGDGILVELFQILWALGSITTNKASGGDAIPVELLQIPKDDAVKSGKLSSGHRTGKGQFSFQFQRKAMQKNAQVTAQLHSSHMLVK